jgi:6-phosphogluconolactonase
VFSAAKSLQYDGRVRKLSFVSVLLFGLSVAQAADPLVYVGTYTRNGSRGIYAFRFNEAAGKLTSLGVAAETADPSFLAEHPNHKFLYAVNEGGRGAGSVSAFAIDTKSGKLTPLNSVTSGGTSPCHLAVDKTGKWLMVANYGDGTLEVIPVQADGKLGEPAGVEKHTGSGATARQRGGHAHEVVFSPDNRFLLLADLGADKIFVYKFDAATGKLTANDPPSGSVPPGAGVRHFVFHPNGRTVYAINEIGNTVTAFHFDPAKGSLETFQNVSTLPQGFSGSSNTAEIAINKAGTRVYGSNRGADSIALFSVDPAKLTLTPVDHTSVMGKTPRNFTLDPTGKYLLAANQDSSDITIFKVHPNTGQLTPVGQPVKDAPVPVCIVFMGK